MHCCKLHIDTACFQAVLARHVTTIIHICIHMQPAHQCPIMKMVVAYKMTLLHAKLIDKMLFML